MAHTVTRWQVIQKTSVSSEKSFLGYCNIIIRPESVIGCEVLKPNYKNQKAEVRRAAQGPDRPTEQILRNIRWSKRLQSVPTQHYWRPSSSWWTFQRALALLSTHASILLHSTSSNFTRFRWSISRKYGWFYVMVCQDSLH